MPLWFLYQVINYGEPQLTSRSRRILMSCTYNASPIIEASSLATGINSCAITLIFFLFYVARKS